MITCRHETEWDKPGYVVEDVDRFARYQAAHIVFEGIASVWANNPDFAIPRSVEKMVRLGFESGRQFVQNMCEPTEELGAKVA